MVSMSAFTGMVIELLLSLIAPFILSLYLFKKGTLSFKSVGFGILVFIVFSQILEKLLHMVMINPTTLRLNWSSNPYLYAIYGALAAGIFEEVGRFIAFRFFLKKERNYTDGLSFGVGHGGIEAILLGVLGAINYIVIAYFINTGTFAQMIGSTVPAAQAELLKSQMIHSSFWIYAMGGLERVAAFIMQVGFSLLVLYGVNKKRFKYVLYAIGLHAFIDFFASLYQVGVLQSLWIIEGFIMFVALVFVYFIIKSRTKFIKL